jgi:hypothetical protein
MRALAGGWIVLGLLILQSGGTGFDLVGPQIIGTLFLAMGVGVWLGRAAAR